MLTLTHINEDKILAFGKELFQQHRDSHPSFESAAQAVVETIYDTCRQPDGDNAFALVRIFRTSRADELLPELQALTTPDYQTWITLMGTVGDEDSWCDRRTSRQHQVIPGDEHGQTTMFRAMLTQLGLNADQRGGEQGFAANSAGMSMTRYFHIEHALNSLHMPTQDTFVKPYGIESVLGMGSPFLSGAVSLLLCFSKTPIDSQTAHILAELTPYVSSLLAAYDGQGVLWGY